MPMKKLASLLLGVPLLTLATFAFAQDKKNEEKKGQEMKDPFSRAAFREHDQIILDV